VLTPGEAARLLSTLRALLDESSEPDRALLIVTHKLDEVLQVADRAVVMRQGRIVEEFQRSEFSAQAMARAMVGREVFSLRRPSSDLRTEQPVRAVPLRVRDLVVSRAGVDWVRGVSLDVPSGQIVGIAGVAGNGQSELVESLSGLLSAKSGQVVLCGDDVTTQDVKARAQRGLAVVPEDRQRHGLVLDMSLCENLLLGHETELSYGPGRQLLDWTKLRGLAAEVLPEAEVRPADPEALARTLSGGNQQKVVLARALAMAKSLPKVLIAAQPTRGVDIGAIETIHKTLLAAKEAGCAILLLSAELSELQALCDRILVMYRGKLVASLDNDPQSPVSREQLGELMAGVGTTVES
jgi:simple sugar transport system ATP-binding protein